MAERYDLAVYIGRFQPFHKAHLEIMKQAFEVADHLLVVIGSRNKTRRTFRNPWTSEERKYMILHGLDQADQSGVVMHRVHTTSVFDVPGDDDAWYEQVHESIERVLTDTFGDALDEDQPDPKVTLIGHTKDASSFYLQTFPRLVYTPMNVPQHLQNLNATDIRRMIISKDPNWETLVPDGTREYIKDWLQTHELPKES